MHKYIYGAMTYRRQSNHILDAYFSSVLLLFVQYYVIIYRIIYIYITVEELVSNDVFF
jgi:hypothetical protein